MQRPQISKVQKSAGDWEIGACRQNIRHQLTSKLYIPHPTHLNHNNIEWLQLLLCLASSWHPLSPLPHPDYHNKAGFLEWNPKVKCFEAHTSQPSKVCVLFFLAVHIHQHPPLVTVKSSSTFNTISTSNSYEIGCKARHRWRG